MLEKLLNVQIFDLEVTNSCNYRCSFCPIEKIAPKGLMTLETFTHFLTNVSPKNTDCISFVGIGEPLLNKNLPTFIGMAKEKYPNVNTWVTTNGSLLTPDRVQQLIKNKLDVIDVSFNGIEKDEYESLMKRGKFDETVANIRSTLQIIEKSNCDTTLQVNFLDGTPRKKDEVLRFWKNMGVKDFRIGKLTTRSGSVDIDGVEPQENDLSKLSCEIFNLFTFIAWNGQVQICCNDTFRKTVFGNVNHDKWETILANKRQMARTKNWPALCKTCTLSQAVWDDREVLKALYKKLIKVVRKHAS